jgi:hypothetical protein
VRGIPRTRQSINAIDFLGKSLLLLWRKPVATTGLAPGLREQCMASSTSLAAYEGTHSPNLCICRMFDRNRLWSLEFLFGQHTTRLDTPIIQQSWQYLNGSSFDGCWYASECNDAFECLGYWHPRQGNVLVRYLDCSTWLGSLRQHMYIHGTSSGSNSLVAPVTHRQHHQYWIARWFPYAVLPPKHLLELEGVTLPWATPHLGPP